MIRAIKDLVMPIRLVSLLSTLDHFLVKNSKSLYFLQAEEGREQEDCDLRSALGQAGKEFTRAHLSQ
jgi:hypothetical protein